MNLGMLLLFALAALGHTLISTGPIFNQHDQDAASAPLHTVVTVDPAPSAVLVPSVPDVFRRLPNPTSSASTTNGLSIALTSAPAAHDLDSTSASANLSTDVEAEYDDGFAVIVLVNTTILAGTTTTLAAPPTPVSALVTSSTSDLHRGAPRPTQTHHHPAPGAAEGERFNVLSPFPMAACVLELMWQLQLPGKETCGL